MCSVHRAVFTLYRNIKIYSHSAICVLVNIQQAKYIKQIRHWQLNMLNETIYKHWVHKPCSK